MSVELPEGWQVIPLSRLLSRSIFTDGDWIESKDQDPNGEVRLIQLADIGDGYFVDKSDRWMTIERAKKLRCTFLEHGDILVARMPDPIGRACSFPFDGEERYVTAVDVCIIRPDSSVDREWLKQALNAPFIRDQIISGATGTTRQRISRKNLGALDFPTPPLSEQKRIAEILSSVDESIRATEAVIAQAERVKRGLMEDLLTGGLGSAAIANGEVPEGWKKYALEEVIQIDWGDTNITKKSYVDQGFVAYSAAGGDGFLPHFDYDGEGIVVSAIGANSGRMFWADGKWSAIKNTMVAFSKSSYINLKFFFYYAQQQDFWPISGGAQPFIGLKNARMARLVIPDAIQQDAAVRAVSSVDDQITTNRATVEQLQRLKRGLMDDLLTGKVRTVA